MPSAAPSLRKNHQSLTRRRTSPQQKAVVGVLRAASVIRRHVVRVLQGHGLTPSQYNVLRILRGAPAGLPTMEIAAGLLDEEPGITRLIDALEGRGFLERIRSSTDRRRIDCRITRHGLGLLGELDGPIDALDRQLLGRLSRTQVSELLRLTGAICEG